MSERKQNGKTLRAKWTIGPLNELRRNEKRCDASQPIGPGRLHDWLYLFIYLSVSVCLSVQVCPSFSDILSSE